MPRRSLVLLFAATATAHAAAPACDLVLELRFDRPAAHASPPRATVAPKVKLDELTLSEAAAEAARAALADLEPALVARVLNRATAVEQAEAFRLMFEAADVAFVAREPRVTLTTLLGQTFLRADAASLREAARLTADEASRLRSRAADEFARTGRALVAELDDAHAGGRVRLEDRDGSPTIALDPATGAPDRLTYELARRLETNAALVTLMADRERRLAARLIHAKRRALHVAWSDPHYATLSRVRYTEPVANGYVDRPVRDFVTNARFRHPYWWETMTKFAEFEDLAAGRAPGPPARITAETSRSPLNFLFGRDAERRIYWPAIREAAGIRPDLSRFGVNETVVDGKVEAVELLVNEAAGARPRGYLFLNLGGELVPAQKFIGLPVARACPLCHAGRKGDHALTFQPFFLRTEGEMRKVGYRGERVIRELLRRR